MNIPANASPEIQECFRTLLSKIEKLERFDIDMKGKRVVGASDSVSPNDYTTKNEIERGYSFNRFYELLKARGLDGFTGELADPQKAKLTVTTSTAGQSVTNVGQLVYETDTGLIKYENGSTLQQVNSNLQAGTYANRPVATSLADGVGYYATDQDTLYVVETGTWVWLTGIMVGTLAPDQRPTLAAGDVGFLFRTSDTAELYRWSGTAWTQLLLRIDSPTLVVDATNHRIGIGLTAPDVLLHLFSGTSGAVLRLGQTASDEYGQVGYDRSGNTKLQITNKYGTNSASAAIEFLIGTGVQLSINGNGVSTQHFGCNGQAAQGSYTSGGALASYVTGAFGLDSDAHMQALFNLVVAIRAALVANGIMS